MPLTGVGVQVPLRTLFLTSRYLSEQRKRGFGAWRTWRLCRSKPRHIASGRQLTSIERQVGAPGDPTPAARSVFADKSLASASCSSQTRTQRSSNPVRPTTNWTRPQSVQARDVPGCTVLTRAFMASGGGRRSRDWCIRARVWRERKRALRWRCRDSRGPRRCSCPCGLAGCDRRTGPVVL